jgi:RNA polymerase sigma-70 factor (ECF subfamily)
VTPRLAINELRSARPSRALRRRVAPEPIITDSHDDPARHAETADSLWLAMLVLRESLSPDSSEPCCSFTMCSTTGVRGSRDPR